MGKSDYTINTGAIRARMFKLYMTQTELAGKASLSQATISNILAGSGGIPSLRKVATALKLRMDVIVIPAPTPASEVIAGSASPTTKWAKTTKAQP